MKKSLFYIQSAIVFFAVFTLLTFGEDAYMEVAATQLIFGGFQFILAIVLTLRFWSFSPHFKRLKMYWFIVTMYFLSWFLLDVTHSGILKSEEVLFASWGIAIYQLYIQYWIIYPEKRSKFLPHLAF